MASAVSVPARSQIIQEATGVGTPHQLTPRKAIGSFLLLIPPSLSNSHQSFSSVEFGGLALQPIKRLSNVSDMSSQCSFWFIHSRLMLLQVVDVVIAEVGVCEASDA